ncbi:MAG: tetratricopeptide repeat protein [Chloroflexi bacterium]|uniref:Tetratricopeptide repeat protein n=1 Tax=Candidatus Chlorohelix allophototropha TaxID=3003348 RepID=A0A8T7LUG1_9CHLR|nr:tetratricopeptide repeat protein [Chloroflexota bacterium]WJW67524.1 tetratricopeptide repeat protein [Chloroflexota bacterium L227-S17]
MPELQLTNEQAAVIGLKIRESRLQQGLQQKDLIEGEFSKSYISLIESGRVVPSAKALRVIANRLGITVEQLLSMATPGSSNQSALEGDPEIFSRWDMALDEARVALYQENPEQAKAVLLQKIKTRQLSTDQLKQFHFLLGHTHLLSSDVELAISEYKTALQMAHSLGDIETEARVTHSMGAIYVMQTKYMLALENFRKALDLIDNLLVKDIKLKLEVLSDLGDCYRSLGDNEHSISLLTEATKLAAELQDCNGLARITWRIANQYREANNLPLAKAFTAKAIALYESIESMSSLISSKTRLGILLYERHEYQQAEQYLVEARNLALRMNDNRLTAIASLHLTSLMVVLNKPQEALMYALESAETAKFSNDTATIGQSFAKLGQAYMQNGDNEKAREYFLQAIEQLKESGSNDILAQTYFEYGQVLSQLGQTEEALRSMEKAYNLQTGVFRSL